MRKECIVIFVTAKLLHDVRNQFDGALNFGRMKIKKNCSGLFANTFLSMLLFIRGIVNYTLILIEK